MDDGGHRTTGRDLLMTAGDMLPTAPLSSTGRLAMATADTQSLAPAYDGAISAR
jgi:hypothetical protein